VAAVAGVRPLAGAGDWLVPVRLSVALLSVSQPGFVGADIL
jgi:hypothetical protein